MLERHEQQPLFDAAFDTFWRDPKLLEQMMYLLLPKISGRGEKQRAPRANRLAEALAAPQGARAAEPGQPDGQGRSAVRHALHLLRPRTSAEGRFREHDHGRIRAGQEAGRRAAAAGGPGAPAPPRGRHQPAARRPPRPARHAAAHGAPAAHAGAAVHAAARGDALAGGADRHLRLDGPLFAAAAALRARPDAPRAEGAHADLRHAADQHHALPEGTRPRCRAAPGRRTGAGLEGRHAHRLVAARVQPAVGAPPAGCQCRAAAGDRRPGPRRTRRPVAPPPRSCTAWRTRWCG